MSSFVKMACSAPLSGPVWADTTFDCALPERSVAAAPAPPRFDAYLTAGLLRPRRSQDADCRSSWAFVLTGAMQYATALAYERLGAHFDSEHMSLEFLLSCYAGDGVCGCFGGELCGALASLAEGGLVTFRQFPYVGSSSDVKPLSRIDLNYYCDRRDSLGTCGPCAPTQADYVETVTRGAASDGGAHFSVPCIPCNQPTAPRYYPHAPFHVGGATRAERVAAVKAELLRLGPLPCAVEVDDAALEVLLRGQQIVRRPEDGLLYRPQRVREGVYHAALIVGYVDVDPASAVWVCRTSWTPAAWFGYALETDFEDWDVQGVQRRRSGLVDNLFNVSMHGAGGGLVERVLSFQEVRVRLDGKAAPGPLSRKDPLLRPLSAATAPRRGHVWLWIALAVVAVLALLALLALLAPHASLAPLAPLAPHASLAPLAPLAASRFV